MVANFQQEAAQIIKMLFDDLGLKEFNAHQFIELYAMGYTKSYRLGLEEYQEVKMFHEVIGTLLSRNADGLGIVYVEHRKSTNVFGKENEVSVWRKK